jgi:hypothetical protein
MRELAGRAAFFDRHPEWDQPAWDRLSEAERGTLEGNAMAAVEAVFDKLELLTQQSSGGQGEGVTQKDFDRAEQLIAEGKIPGGQGGEVGEGADDA